MFKVKWTPLIQEFWLKEDKPTWLKRFMRLSQYMTAEGELNSPAMSAFKRLMDPIREGRLHHYEQIIVFFAPGNLVSRTDHNFA